MTLVYPEWCLHQCQQFSMFGHQLQPIMKIHLQSFIGLHITDTERWVDVTDHFTGPKSEKSVIFILVCLMNFESESSKSVSFYGKNCLLCINSYRKNINIMLNLMNWLTLSFPSRALNSSKRKFSKQNAKRKKVTPFYRFFRISVWYAFYLSAIFISAEKLYIPSTLNIDLARFQLVDLKCT